ncbi:unnamed protein product [Moneuplotes crassus]|uniref:Uncharacterized protein n=1 Tax=Euplotes crassus TaxID=5936 RepID=A0AAD2D2W3_EUPCR|nr:unnamed protein product [Moneuplotes crassus]
MGSLRSAHKSLERTVLSKECKTNQKVVASTAIKHKFTGMLHQMGKVACSFLSTNKQDSGFANEIDNIQRDIVKVDYFQMFLEDYEPGTRLDSIQKLCEKSFPRKLNSWTIIRVRKPKSLQVKLDHTILYKNISCVAKKFELKHWVLSERDFEKFFMACRHLESLVFTECEIPAQKFSKNFIHHKYASTIKLKALRFNSCNLRVKEVASSDHSTMKTIVGGVISSTFWGYVKTITCTTSRQYQLHRMKFTESVFKTPKLNIKKTNKCIVFSCRQ